MGVAATLADLISDSAFGTNGGAVRAQLPTAAEPNPTHASLISEPQHGIAHSLSSLGFWDESTMARAGTMPLQRDCFGDYQDLACGLRMGEFVLRS